MLCTKTCLKTRPIHIYVKNIYMDVDIKVICPVTDEYAAEITVGTLINDMFTHSVGEISVHIKFMTIVQY